MGLQVDAQDALQAMHLNCACDFCVLVAAPAARCMELSGEYWEGLLGGHQGQENW